MPNLLSNIPFERFRLENKSFNLSDLSDVFTILNVPKTNLNRSILFVRSFAAVVECSNLDTSAADFITIAGANQTTDFKNFLSVLPIDVANNIYLFYCDDFAMEYTEYFQLYYNSLSTLNTSLKNVSIRATIIHPEN